MWVVKVTVCGNSKKSYFLGEKPEFAFDKKGAIYETTKKENAYKFSKEEDAAFVAHIVGEYSDMCEGEVELF